MNSCLKYFFVIFNLVFVAGGALCIGFVVWVQKFELFESTLNIIGVDQALFYSGILLGGLLLLIGLCGSIGACYEKKGILGAYMSIILFFVGCEIAAFVYAFVRGPSDFVENLEIIWKTVSNETKFVVQQTFNCCGYLNASEWENNFHESCMKTIDNATLQQTWDAPCSDELLSYFQVNILVFGGTLGAVLFVQIFQALITSLLIRSINNNNRVESETGVNDRTNNASLSNRSVPKQSEQRRRNVCYDNAGYENDDTLFDDSRGRSIHPKRKTKSSNSSNW